MWMTAESLAALEAERTVLEERETSLTQDEQVRLLTVRRSIQEADVDAKPNDGVAEDGMLVTVAFADGDSESFVLAEAPVGDDVTVVSVGSPIGRALVGRRVGDEIAYSAPNGTEIRATLTHAVPYGSAASVA